MLLVSLLFAGMAVTGATTGKVFGGGLTTFLILFGLGVSPLPGETPELFSTRIAYVLFAILYALCMASLFWPRPRAASHYLARQSLYCCLSGAVYAQSMEQVPGAAGCRLKRQYLR
jgi:hypothetical protein